MSRVRGNNSDSEEMSADSLELEIIQIMEVVGFETMIALMEQAFPAQFAPLDDSDDDFDESLLSEELSSTTDAETSSDDNA